MKFEKQSELKAEFDRRKLQRLEWEKEKMAEKVGTIIISFIFGIATGLMMTAYFISLTLR